MSSHKLSNDDEDKSDDDDSEEWVSRNYSHSILSLNTKKNTYRMDINGHIEYKTFFFFDIDDRLQGLIRKEKQKQNNLCSICRRSW